MQQGLKEILAAEAAIVLAEMEEMAEMEAKGVMEGRSAVEVEEEQAQEEQVEVETTERIPPEAVAALREAEEHGVVGVAAHLKSQ